ARSGRASRSRGGFPTPPLWGDGGWPGKAGRIIHDRRPRAASRGPAPASPVLVDPLSPSTANVRTSPFAPGALQKLSRQGGNALGRWRARLRSGLGLELRSLGQVDDRRWGVLEREGEHLVHPLDAEDLHLLLDFLGHVDQVLDVALGN